jgi:hypothetical protein
MDNPMRIHRTTTQDPPRRRDDVGNDTGTAARHHPGTGDPKKETMQNSLPLFPHETTSPHSSRRPVSPLRPHQREAFDAIVRALENPDTDTADTPHGGARATAVIACGTGKTRIAAAVAAALAPRGRVLVLVPTLDLLTQTVTAWHSAGRVGGTQIAVCSLTGDPTLGAADVRCTTSAPRLALWAAASGPLTVYATYQSLGTILTAHTGPYGLALAEFDLVVVDEAHRVSRSLGKEWAAVHDNTRLPAARRLYLTATPRVWEPPENSAYTEATLPDTNTELPPPLAQDDVWEDPDLAADRNGGGAGPDEEWTHDDRDEEEDDRPVRVRGGRPAHSALPARTVASMDDESIYGPVVHRLELAESTRMGLIARPRVVVVEITDPQVQDLAHATGTDLNRGLDAVSRRSRSTGPRAWSRCRPPSCGPRPTTTSTR